MKIESSKFPEIIGNFYYVLRLSQITIPQPYNTRFLNHKTNVSFMFLKNVTETISAPQGPKTKVDFKTAI